MSSDIHLGFNMTRLQLATLLFTTLILSACSSTQCTGYECYSGQRESLLRGARESGYLAGSLAGSIGSSGTTRPVRSGYVLRPVYNGWLNSQINAIANTLAP